MLPEKTHACQELQDECQYFKQQLFNEVRRVIMMDYLSSRDSFMDVGEQYVGHLSQNIKEWHKFSLFYSDVNNDRKSKDDEYKRDQFIGEELDWKMLADNLSLFQSQSGDLKDMQGFDPNDSLQIDQSIMQDHEINVGSSREAPFDHFSDKASNDNAGYARSNSLYDKETLQSPEHPKLQKGNSEISNDNHELGSTGSKKDEE